jgi:hypothetical protein
VLYVSRGLLNATFSRVEIALPFSGAEYGTQSDVVILDQYSHVASDSSSVSIEKNEK